MIIVFDDEGKPWNQARILYLLYFEENGLFDSGRRSRYCPISVPGGYGYARGVGSVVERQLSHGPRPDYVSRS